MNSTYQRASKRAPCVICGRHKFCVLIDGGRLVLCTKVEAGSVKPSKDGSGWIHVLRDEPSRRIVPRVAEVPKPAPDLGPLVADAIQRTPADWRAGLARSLRLPMPSGDEALRRLGAHRARYVADDVLRLAPRDAKEADQLRRWCAWIGRADVAAWPMWVRGRVVGVRTRNTATREKMSLPGGREGLFVPLGLAVGLDLLAFVEGPTDCAALLAVGVETVGRPNRCGAVEETVRLTLVRKPRALAVVLDRDKDGIKGGVVLARELAPVVGDVRCVLPPVKDAREWVAAGATHDDVLAAIDGGRRV